jgi:hypothetical protein
MEGSKTLFSSSKFPWARKEFLRNLYTIWARAVKNILLSTLFSNTLSLRSFLNVSDQISFPYKATGTIVVVHIVIFICLGNKLEDNRFCTE